MKTTGSIKATTARLCGVFAMLLCCITTQATDHTSVPSDGKQDYWLANGDNVSFDVSVEDYYVIDGWFGTGVTQLGTAPYTFNGPNGVYTFRRHEGRGGVNYLEVVPLKELGSSGAYTNKDSYFHNDECTNHLMYNPANPTGPGAIWVSGGQNLGFPNALWTVKGWTGNGVDNYGDNTTAMFRNGNTYSISVTTGKEMLQQIYGTTDAAVFMLKFYHSPEFEVYKDGQWRKYFEFRHTAKSDPVVGSDLKTLIEFYPAVDYLYVTDGTNADNPAHGEGNITPPTIGFDSELPYMPDGYKLNFTIKVEDFPAGFSATRVPLGVTFEQTSEVAALYSGVSSQSHTKYTVFLSDAVGNKRITLRDALRFDCNLPYAQSYDGTGGEPAAVVSRASGIDPIQELVVNGIVSADDMQYLAWLVKKDKVGTLDLTKAVLPGNAIPESFAYVASGGNRIDGSYLTTVKLPATLTSIGAHAFDGCRGLATVVMEGIAAGSISVGADAFNSCSSLTSAQINAIITRINGTISEGTFANCTNSGFASLTIPSNIATIGERAFSSDVNIRDVYVPNNVTSGTVSVGSPYGTNGSYTIPDVSDGSSIESEDFDCVNGVGYRHTSNHGGNSLQNDYRTDDAVNVVWLDNYGSNGHCIAWVNGDDFYNYTFNCVQAGNYTLRFLVSRNLDVDEEAVKTSISIDGGTVSTLTVSKDGITNWETFSENAVFENVPLTAGLHVLTVSTPTGNLNYDKVTFVRTGDTESASQSIPDCLNANTFEGINANHCEVHFTGSHANNQHELYRATDGSGDYVQKGWMYLLTKTASNTNTQYDIVPQMYADFVLQRTFKQGWTTLALPFGSPVSGKTVNGVQKYADAFNSAVSGAFNHVSTYRGVDASDVIVLMIQEATDGLRDFEPLMLKLNNAVTNVTFRDVDVNYRHDYNGVPTGEGISPASMVTEWSFVDSDQSGFSDLDGGAFTFTGVFKQTVNATATSMDFIKAGDYILQNNAGTATLVKCLNGRQYGLNGFSAYLKANDVQGAKAATLYTMEMEYVPTGIESLTPKPHPLTPSPKGEGEAYGIYDLYGRKVAELSSHLSPLTSHLSNGIYIVNGKKIVVR